MIQQWYSKCLPNELLHILVPLDNMEVFESRRNIGDDSNALQIGLLNLERGMGPSTHFHNPTTKTITQTQECWVLTNGTISITFCDVDGKELDTKIIEAPALISTLRGGHSFNVLSERVNMIEIKAGAFRPKQVTPEK